MFNGCSADAGVNALGEKPRAFGVMPLADGLSPALRIAGFHVLAQLLRLRPTAGVSFEIRQHLIRSR